ncbi:hypothetical protein PSTEL_00755 [Paenibacillus stellifer]|uniref:HTH cro/C1-type domain-containing protein n=1 Tax=Paenibacillus stellifer TaxID=169760 RepID=A0A089LLW5_9BACL|nr:helix-turn-helix transcriptional regulator [Paenibacillus stellifer]AIQ61872.1 hypothetical protein PSTEL_00755 [Paenibacillus stellifer]
MEIDSSPKHARKQTIKEIRLEQGFDLKYISRLVDIPESLLIEYENNPAHITIGLAVIISSIYKAPLSSIEFTEDNPPHS